jgi:o-succinylbenzoate synthase
MTELRRTLSRGDLVFAVMGNVIGSGIFLVPSETLRATGGSTVAALVVWLLGGVLCLLGALSYAELGAADPQAGGIYCYIRDAFSPLPAFLYGWVLFLIIGPASVAALTVAAVAYLRQLVPMGEPAAHGVTVAAIAVITVVNVVGARESANVQNVGAAVKGGALLVLGAVLLVLGRADPFAGAGGAPAGDAPSLLAGLGAGMVGVLWAYEGWQWVTFSAGETRDPQRAFPAGLVIGTAALVGLYVLTNAAFFAALGPTAAGESRSVAVDAVTATLGPGAGKGIAAVVVLATLSAAHSSVLTVPRVFYQMARDGLFFRRLAVVHPRFRTPAAAIGWSAVLSVAFALTGTFEQLLTCVVFTAWIFYGLGALALLVLRRRAPHAPRPFRVPGYPVTPALFVVAAAAVVVNTLATQTAVSLVGLAVLLAGVPAFYAWRGTRSRTRRRRSVSTALGPRRTPLGRCPSTSTASRSEKSGCRSASRSASLRACARSGASCSSSCTTQAGASVWSECVAGEEPNYSEETIDTAWHAVTEWAAPRVLGRTFDGPAGVHHALARDFRGHHMAKAAVEMGCWGLASVLGDVSLARLLGGVQDRVVTGVSLGIQASPAALVERACAAVADGYRKVKLKIQPGADVEYVRAVRAAVGADIQLMVDANSAYTLADAERLAELDAFGLLMIEQPLAADDLVRHATLQRRLATPICLDESITSPDRAEDMLALGSGRIINIKPGRVGGYAASIAIHDLCERHGVAVWCGGMLESGVGRAYNVALASLRNFTLPGDLSPSRRYWERDLVTPEWSMSADGTVHVPRDRAGIGVRPDVDRIDALTVRRRVLTARPTAERARD